VLKNAPKKKKGATLRGGRNTSNQRFTLHKQYRLQPVLHPHSSTLRRQRR